MVKIFTPAYGTALNYGSNIRVEEPLFAAAVFTNKYRREALFHKTAEFLAMGIDSGRSIDAIATHTLRCSPNFIGKDNVVPFNMTAVEIARRAREQYGRKESILIFGDMSVMGDCYAQASLASSVDEAVEYHLQQAVILKEAGVNALWAETVGNLTEAQAFAKIAEQLQMPLYISLVLDPCGNVLDGTPIDELVRRVDDCASFSPRKYLTNCSWENQVEAMYKKAEESGVLHRLGGFYNNASNMLHGDKQCLTAVQRYAGVAEYIQWVEKMLQRFPHLTQEEDVWISGCCGFGADDIDQIFKRIG